MDYPDAPDWPGVSCADVLNMTVEDVMGDSGIDISHPAQEEQDQWLDKIRYEYLRQLNFPHIFILTSEFPFRCLEFEQSGAKTERGSGIESERVSGRGSEAASERSSRLYSGRCKRISRKTQVGRPCVLIALSPY